MYLAHGIEIEALDEENVRPKYDMLKIKIRLNEAFPISLMNKNYLKESYLVIKYKHKKYPLQMFVDSVILRKIFIFLFWIYYIERY